MIKLYRFYITAVLAGVVLTGCVQKKAAADVPAAVTEQAQTEEIPKESKQEAPETEKEPKSLRYSGAEYLSVKGIEAAEGTSIAMVATNSQNQYWNAVKEGAMDAVADLNEALGFTGKSKIKLSYDAPKGENVVEQINIIDQFLDKAPDALCVAFLDETACKTQMEMAKNNGIRLIAFDTMDENRLTEAAVATNNQEAAAEAAEKMFEAIGYEGKIAILVHNSQTQSAQIRKQAIIDEMTQNYNDKNIQFVEIVYAAQEERSSSQILSELLEKHEDLAGIICTDLLTTEMAIDYAKGLEEPGFQIVGFDTSEKILSEVGNLLVGTMAQDPYHMGYATIVAAARAVSGMGNVTTVYTDHMWIDADTISTPEAQGILQH